MMKENINNLFETRKKICPFSRKNSPKIDYKESLGPKEIQKNVSNDLGPIWNDNLTLKKKVVKIA